MRNLFLHFVLMTFQMSYAQVDTLANHKKRNFAWYSPSDAQKVNGLLFNFIFVGEKKGPSVTNGLEFDINPITALAAPIIFIHGALDPDFSSPSKENTAEINFNEFRKINGLKLGLGSFEKYKINGVEINATGSLETTVNGVSISLIINKQHIVNGLTLATLGNHNIKCRGIQLGLINSCPNLRGFQFGLWNKNHKRELPFINFAFK
jgi:hypothetical protein